MLGLGKGVYYNKTIIFIIIMGEEVSCTFLHVYRIRERRIIDYERLRYAVVIATDLNSRNPP